MKVERLERLERVPLAIDSRRLYRADALISVAGRVTSPAPIEFSLELSPFGGHEVSVTFLDRLDYPMIPAMNILKHYITTLDRDGGLP
ncbi:MAG: hypothetical protein ACOC2V_00700 [Alkalispirochaeta sp.]